MKPIPKEEKKILELFYRTELREGEDVIDNRSPLIAKELNLNISMVNQTLDREIKRKVKALDDSIKSNSNIHIDDLEVIHEEVKPPNNKPFANKDINKKQTYHSSKYTGVCWFKRDNNWKASIRIKGKLKHLGYFESEFKAHLAYEDALEEINFEKQPNLYFNP